MTRAHNIEETAWRMLAVLIEDFGDPDDFRDDDGSVEAAGKMAITFRHIRDLKHALGHQPPEHARAVDRCFELRGRLEFLFDVIVAEFESDPMSVQCFDLRIVDEAKKVNDELKALKGKYPFIAIGAQS